LVDTKETVEINSQPFGKIQVSSDQKIIFDEGLYGFERYKVFYLLSMKDDEESPFLYLQNGEDVYPSFILINPYLFKQDYVLDVSPGELQKIGINTEEDAKENLLVFVIVTIPEDSSGMTANLLGPVLINKNLKSGIQALSLNEKYGTKHNIIEEMKNK